MLAECFPQPGGSSKFQAVPLFHLIFSVLSSIVDRLLPYQLPANVIIGYCDATIAFPPIESGSSCITDIFWISSPSSM
jgi:hypothetical protein